tara:strand:- start:18603 stop:19403 length:801 start_codon:yes stop_codon:yes gene_type:complete
MNLLKKLLKPLRKIFTKALIDPSAFDNHINRRIWHETNAFRWAAAYVVKNQISGDYLEFGVWKGNSFIEAFNQIEEYSDMFYSPTSTLGKSDMSIENTFKNMRFHAFDSFEGLSASTTGNEPLQYFEGNYKAEEEVFLNRLKEAKLDLSRVTTTKGWFNESLTVDTAKNISLKDVAIAYIDCDLYEPALDSLNFITPYIKSGTILVFDDWFRNKGNPKEGVQGAVLKWLESNPNIYLQHYYSCDTRTTLFIVQTGTDKTDKNINSV